MAMEQWNGYEEFVDSLQLRGIFLDGLTANLERLALSQGGEDAELHVSAKQETDVKVIGDRVLVAQVRFSVTARIQGVRKAFGRVKVSFDIVLGNCDALPDEYADRFKANMAHIAWPYMREIVESIAMRSALPIPIAPLMPVTATSG